jgi:hypothetical protein
MASYREGSRSADQYPGGTPPRAPDPVYNPQYSTALANSPGWQAPPPDASNPLGAPRNLDPGPLAPKDLWGGQKPADAILPLAAFDSGNVGAINNYSTAYYEAIKRGDFNAAQQALTGWNQMRTGTGQAGYMPTVNSYDLAMNAYAAGLGPHPDTGMQPGSYALANNAGWTATQTPPDNSWALPGQAYAANVAGNPAPNPLTAPYTGANQVVQTPGVTPPAAQTPPAQQQQGQMGYQDFVSLLNGLLGGQGLVGSLLGQQNNNNTQLTQALSALQGFMQIAALMNPWQNQGLYNRRKYPVTQ